MRLWWWLTGHWHWWHYHNENVYWRECRCGKRQAMNYFDKWIDVSKDSYLFRGTWGTS